MAGATDPRPERTALLRRLPAVDRVVRLLDGGPRAAAAARAVLERCRDAIAAGELDEAPTAEQIATRVRARLAAESAAAYPRVVNATGVLLHTGLGRAPLAPAAADAIAAIADGYCLLEVERGEGGRRDREHALLELLGALTGAPAATVVNNNAAALLLALRALAAGREVVVSRGELIEIGGGFRLPELMALSGARLVEVGTTNRTYAADYERAIGEHTALLLAVHTSNYRVVGFHHAPRRAELVAIARRHGVPLVEDIGSGLLAAAGGPLAGEPPAAEALAEGADLVLFSGDKLLGGPQAGVLAGRADLVERCRRDPLFRAVRPDRLALAALAATLRLHRDAPDEVPVLAALRAAPRARLEQARALAHRLGGAFAAARPQAVLSEGRVGSGSSPGAPVGSAAVELTWPGLDAEQLARRLRAGTPCVFGRIWKGRYQLDVLALRPGDEARLHEALAALPVPEAGVPSVPGDADRDAPAREDRPC